MTTFRNDPTAAPRTPISTTQSATLDPPA
jgi:hypothetical protein